VLAVGLGVGQGCGLSRGGPRAAACRVRAGAGCGRVWRWCTGNVVNKCRQATPKTAAWVAASARRGIKAALRSAHGFDRSQHRRGGTAASHRSLRQRSGGMHPAAAGPPSSPPVGRGRRNGWVVCETGRRHDTHRHGGGCRVHSVRSNRRARALLTPSKRQRSCVDRRKDPVGSPGLRSTLASKGSTRERTAVTTVPP